MMSAFDPIADIALATEQTLWELLEADVAFEVIGRRKQAELGCPIDGRLDMLLAPPLHAIVRRRVALSGNLDLRKADVQSDPVSGRSPHAQSGSELQQRAD